MTVLANTIFSGSPAGTDVGLTQVADLTVSANVLGNTVFGIDASAGAVRATLPPATGSGDRLVITADDVTNTVEIASGDSLNGSPLGSVFPALDDLVYLVDAKIGDWTARTIGGGADNLGNHQATQDLNMFGNDITVQPNSAQGLSVNTASAGTNGDTGDLEVASGFVNGNGGYAGGVTIKAGDHTVANAAQAKTGTQGDVVIHGSDGLNAGTLRPGGDVVIRGGDVINAEAGGSVELTVGDSATGADGELRIRTAGVLDGSATAGQALTLANPATGEVEFGASAAGEFNSTSATPTSTDATLTFAAGDLNFNDPLSVETWFAGQSIDASSVGGSATQSSVLIDDNYVLLVLTGPTAITDSPYVVWFSGLNAGDTIETDAAMTDVSAVGAGTLTAADQITADGTGLVGARVTGVGGLTLALSGATMHFFGEIPAPAAATPVAPQSDSTIIFPGVAIPGNTYQTIPGMNITLPGAGTYEIRAMIEIVLTGNPAAERLGAFILHDGAAFLRDGNGANITTLQATGTSQSVNGHGTIITDYTAIGPTTIEVRAQVTPDQVGLTLANVQAGSEISYRRLPDQILV